MKEIIRDFVDAVNLPHLEGQQIRPVSDYELEMFAELIAMHCADIATQSISGRLMQADARALSIASQIKQQFGLQ